MIFHRFSRKGHPVQRSEEQSTKVTQNDPGSYQTVWLKEARLAVNAALEYVNKVQDFETRVVLHRLGSAVSYLTTHLEDNPLQSPTTEPATMEIPSGVLAGPILQEILALSQQLGVLTEAERSHVERCLICTDHLEQSLESCKTHALVVDGITSTLAKQGYSLSVDPTEPAQYK